MPDLAEADDFFGLVVAGDFNGDGHDDLAIGVPREDLSGIENCGAVHVLYGSPTGLSALLSDFWYQGAGILESSEAGDHFGSALAAGDFDGDGFDDLAVAAHGETLGGAAGAGIVQVLYGSAGGLSDAGNQVWHQDSPNIQGMAEDADLFGYSLAAGHFNPDGFADLAIGVPFEDVGAIADAGAVNVLYGSASGLSDANNQLWHQDSGFLLDSAEESDRFGYSLAAGSFDGNVTEDLAIGVYLESIGTATNAGAVAVLYGFSFGLSDLGNQLWHQDVGTVLDVAEDGDTLGSAVATGDFNGDSYADLAMGGDGESVDGWLLAGAVNVLYGSASGLSDAGNQLWTQNSTGVLDLAEAYDFLGGTLAAGDFDDDGHDELVIGVPAEDLGTVGNSGAIHVVVGSAAGLIAAGNQFLHQDTPGISDDAESTDAFGLYFAVGDFSGNGTPDLAVAAPGEEYGGVVDAGAVHVLHIPLLFADGFESSDTAAWSSTSP